MSAKKITIISLISVFAYLSMLFIKFPVSFLTYDIKAVIICIGGIILGTIPAVFICVIVSVLEMITISSTGVIGLFMNIIANISYVIPICILYSKMKNKNKALILGIIIGTISLSICMFLFNLIATPLYMGVSLKETIGLLFSLITPFNLIKGATNGILLLVLYKPILKIITKSGI